MPDQPVDRSLRAGQATSTATVLLQYTIHDTLEPLYKVTYDQLCRFALPAATVVVVAAAMVVVAAAVED